MSGFALLRRALVAAALAVVAAPGVAGAAPPPLDPQQVQDQQDMTFGDYKPIPGVDWATNGAVPTDRKVTIALVAFDFPDQPFVITQPKGSDPFSNPQIDPIPRADVPKFYADFYNTPSALNHGHTINGYWMEQSGGKIGITRRQDLRPVHDAEEALPVRAQRHRPARGKPTGNGCPARDQGQRRAGETRDGRGRLDSSSSTPATSVTFSRGHPDRPKRSPRSPTRRTSR